MDAETLRRAFEPFFTTKEVERGTGLGLAGVYGTVRQAGGVVNLRSKPGVGTVAEVYLPATDTPPRSQQVATVASDATAGPAGYGGHERLLLVEDEPAVSRVVSRLLEEAGYAVIAPGSAGEAMRAIQAGRQVDLLITDVMMPALTGPELSRCVHDIRPGLPVLFISGYTAGALDDVGRLDAGMALLEKPFTREALLDAVARLLGR
jgi:CheY-like chemotaxis protein